MLDDFNFESPPEVGGNELEHNAPAPTPKESAPVSDMPMGVFTDMSNEDYHRSQAISKSGLDKLEESPSHLWYYLQQGSSRTHALDFGSLFHDLVLMPDGYTDKHYPVMPHFDLRKTAGRDDRDCWLSTLASWQLPVTTQDMEMAEAMKNSILINPDAGWMVKEARASGECENSHFGIDDETFTYVRVRPDLKLMGHGLLGDLKSTEDCSKRAFENSMKAFNYHKQDAMYRHVVEHTTGAPINDFWFIATEKKAEKPVTAIYRLSPDDYQEGWDLYRNNLTQYEELLANEGGFTAPVEATLPRFARKF